MADSRITNRMKVYRTRIGFHDWVVAANSQKAALEAWDLRNKDLFASGAARVVNDPSDVELAMKTPGVPVIAPGQGKLKVPDAPAKVVKKPAKAEAKPEPEPDRSMLEAAEEALRRFEKKTTARLASLEARKAELEVEIDEVSTEATRERRRLQQQAEKERKRLA